MSVAPEYRGMGIAKIFMSLLERLAGPQDPSDLSNYSDPSISESSGINPLTGLPNIPNSQNSLTPGSKSTQKSYDQSQPQSQSQDPIGTANPIESSFSPPKESSYVMRDAVNAWFVDLFVRCNNVRAVEMYERLGYSVFRRVQNYYQSIEEVSSPDELDGFDMRKSMPRDTTSRYVRSNGRDILVGPDQVWA
ncbi:hypothetical protein M231_00415 [Tremella mesenterica]|uniref:N-acetyltransferase domain-containing protein n=2 Tax=Tremella mesenterica TaxID=5217 RepID=A0A4Q1BW88_TREME|nr:hypothetical protein M231_00415 [Tremella mesenterica]